MSILNDLFWIAITTAGLLGAVAVCIGLVFIVVMGTTICIKQLKEELAR